MQMVKRIMLLSVFVGSTGIVGASPALAGSKLGTCPDNSDSANQWQLVTVESVGSPTGAPSIDGNGNGLTCIKFAPGLGQLGIPTIRDDSVGPQSS